MIPNHQEGSYDSKTIMNNIKTALIILAHGGTLLSANKHDFQQVPGMQVEDWLQS